MFLDQFVRQRSKLRKPPSHGKQHLLFGRKVKLNFLLEVARDFHLPLSQFDRTRPQRAINPHAQSECVLVLTGQRHQIGVAEHARIIPPQPGLCLLY